ncbi:MAG: hypothetical protein DMG71_15575 [Acidobacteria bacterium]|nr:MAG: hypothetical protein DMG71_15575 [Acidobacteriota bacterium]
MPAGSQKKWRHFVSLESSPQDDAFVVDSVHLKYTLGNIQPDCRNLLEPASSIKSAATLLLHSSIGMGPFR